MARSGKEARKGPRKPREFLSFPGYFCGRHEVVDAHVGGLTSRRRVFHFGGNLTRFERPFGLRIEWAALHTTQPEPTVCASGGARPVSINIGGSGKVKRSYTERHVATRKGASAMGFKTEAYFREALTNQGLPADFLAESPFTVAGKIHAVGNGVPLAMGRAVARAVKAAVSGQ